MHIPILYPDNFSKFEKWKVEVPKVSTNFQNRLCYTTKLQAMNITFSQRMIKPTNLSLFEGLYR